MARVAWAATALNDVREITRYLSEFSRSAAEEFQAKVKRAATLLETTPKMGRIVPDFGIECFREVILRPYRLMYIVNEEDCEIVALVDGRRDLRNLIRPADYGL